MVCLFSLTVYICDVPSSDFDIIQVCLLLMLLMLYLRNHCLIPDHKDFYLCSSSRNFHGLALRSFWVHFSAWYAVEGYLYFCVIGFPIVLTLSLVSLKSFFILKATEEEKLRNWFKWRINLEGVHMKFRVQKLMYLERSWIQSPTLKEGGGGRGL